MIVVNFDGRNVHTIADALEYKILFAILNQITDEQALLAAALMQHDGFIFTKDEVKQMVRGAVIVSRPLNKSISNSDPESHSECDICTQQHDEEDHEHQLDEPLVN
jgi:hypothetical protein